MVRQISGLAQFEHEACLKNNKAKEFRRQEFRSSGVQEFRSSGG
jgi:hypothetical protein